MCSERGCPLRGKRHGGSLHHGLSAPSTASQAFVPSSKALTEVWRQALFENAKIVELGPERHPVRGTPKRGLRQVDFIFEGNDSRAGSITRKRKPKCAQLARSGNKVMEFLTEGRYMANVVDGKMTIYGGRAGRGR